ncbi:MAG: TMEM165/GDT1 family protein [Methylocystis sp.]
MEALVTSTLVVAIAEIGDKTQLLALVLACRFRRPVPIALGILIATLANHAAAAWIGGWLEQMLAPSVLHWVLGGSFGMAGWALIPDNLDTEAMPKPAVTGPFLTALVAFFLVEIGDKTQVATIALAMRFDSLITVVLGTTLGMMLANLPVVFLGDGIAARLPLKLVRLTAAAIFAVLGLVALLGPLLS